MDKVAQAIVVASLIASATVLVVYGYGEEVVTAVAVGALVCFIWGGDA